MSLHLISPSTLWALAVMETACALPLISLPTQGNRVPGALGPLLIALLLPAGLAASRTWDVLRDPSWRMLWAIGLTVLARIVVGVPPEPDIASVLGWIAQHSVACAIGIGLWWRGASLSATELIAADVRREYIVLSVCLIGLLALVRPFVLMDPVLLGVTVASFTLGGLFAAGFARQDAANAHGKHLAGAVLGLAAALGLAVTLILQPARATAILSGIGWLLSELLRPLVWLLGWLASSLPRLGPITPPPPMQQPTPLPLPDPRALDAIDNGAAWVGTLIAFVLVAMLGAAVLLVVRLMLQQWLNRPPPPEAVGQPAVSQDAAGAPSADLTRLLRRLLHLLWPALRRGQAGRGTGRRSPDGRGPLGVSGAEDARAIYRALLAWAAGQGRARRTSETPHELARRLGRDLPLVDRPTAEITSAYEQARYGERAASAAHLRRLRAALNEVLRLG